MPTAGAQGSALAIREESEPSEALGCEHVIESVSCRRILNSHVELTNEFVVRLDTGSTGVAASPQGETISIYEDRNGFVPGQNLIERLQADGIIGTRWTQERFDAYLGRRFGEFGRNNAYGLSLAYCHAASDPLWVGADVRHATRPKLCFNILNGGRHAYTNPVLSDFPEFLLVERSSDIFASLEKHNELQRVVKQELLRKEKTVVCGNPVSRFQTADNRECIEFLLDMCGRLGVADDFEVMIDASASDLRNEHGYAFDVTDRSVRSSDDLYEYWMDLIEEFPIRFLEDPFCEQDLQSWRRLTTGQRSCRIIGDNVYSSDSRRIQDGAAQCQTHGVVLKPNQAGTVTAIRQAIEAAQQAKQVTIASHRSISTEETFLSRLACAFGLQYVKVGPLGTDYSSVMRVNEMLRCSEVSEAHAH